MNDLRLSSDPGGWGQGLLLSLGKLLLSGNSDIHYIQQPTKGYIHLFLSNELVANYLQYTRASQPIRLTPKNIETIIVGTDDKGLQKL